MVHRTAEAAPSSSSRPPPPTAGVGTLLPHFPHSPLTAHRTAGAGLRGPAAGVADTAVIEAVAVAEPLNAAVAVPAAAAAVE